MIKELHEKKGDSKRMRKEEKWGGKEFMRNKRDLGGLLEKREMKGKGQKERYTHLNAEF